VHVLFQLGVDSLFKFGGEHCLGLGASGDCSADQMGSYDPAGVFWVSLPSGRGSVPAIQVLVQGRTPRGTGLCARLH
jgi:hypothetical protein